MKDPYKVLGVEHDATDAEIKKAYYALAKKYHPDNYQDSDLADLAAEKMKEINEAYAEIERIRSGGGGYDYAYDDGAQTGAQTGSPYNSGSGGSGGYSATYSQVRSLINERRLDRAMSILSAIPEARRDAEWHYLYGCVMLGGGNFVEATRHIETACYMDPNNSEYAAARSNIRSRSSAYGTPYGKNQTDDCCRVCQTLWCMDCCCECMGGDFIRCC